MTSDILTGLNSKQREAVETVEGPLLIVAGPGSGKTRVITHRVAYLVRTCGVSPRRIVAVTFTNRAAREMRQRLASLLSTSAQDLVAGTFHSFCAMVLRRDGEKIGLASNFVIYDDDDQLELLKRSMKEVDVDPKQFAPRKVQSAISAAKSQLLDVEGFALRRENYFDEVVLRVYERYEQLMSQSSAADFDDLLLKAYLLLTRAPEVAHKYQERYVHFMIDEFQDTNVAQYAIARQLSQAHRNLCVVGDPDQSIYSWRNADIRNILSFQHDYPEARVIALEENYRSTTTILGAARKLIAANTQRVEKDLWTRNKQGVPVVISERYNEQEEAQFVVKEVQNLTRSQGYALGDIAVMYRVNAQSRALEEACLRYGVPYQVVGSIKFYQRQEVKDVVAYLRLVANPDDDVSLTRIVNVPPRGIGRRTLDELVRIARNSNVSMFAAAEAVVGSGESSGAAGGGLIAPAFPARTTRALSDFLALIKALAAQAEASNLLDLIDLVVERTGYKRFLLEETERGEERWENVREFQNAARDFLHLGIRDALTAFLESVSLVSDVDNLEQKADLMTLITLHQAKGLEFPVVFIVGMEEGILPHSRSMEVPLEMEEERRLCYVGMTRAKERLYLVRAFRRGFRGAVEPGEPSRFLADIPPELVTTPSHAAPTAGRLPVTVRSLSVRGAGSIQDYKRTAGRPASAQQARQEEPARPAPALSLSAGDKVRHATFGDGIVVSCVPSGADFQITVAFKDGQGVKRLLLSFAPMEKVQ